MRLRSTAFLVDGFNLYHSVLEASNDLNLHGAGTRWLDLPSLFRSYLPSVRAGIGSPVQIGSIHYFSALATHLDGGNSGKVARHQQYLRCLKDAGVLVELGRFKAKGVWCKTCRASTQHWEEKESGVAMSVRLTQLALQEKCDVAVLVTGDTDIAPAVRMVKNIAPDFKIIFAFPYKRKNKELAKLADFSFNMNKENYHNHQLPNPVKLSDGTSIVKPPVW